MSSSLICPKCQSEMRSYERNRVLVDQCTGCGGLFLDKGELEALSAAENAWHGQSQPEPQQPSGATHQQAAQAPGYAPSPQPGYAQPYPPGQRYAGSKTRYAQGYPGGQRYAGSKAYYGNKRRSFLGDLFG